MNYTVEDKFKKLITEGKKRSHDNGIDRKLQLCNFDEEKIDLGCQTFQRHFFSMFVSMLAGLLSLLYIPTIVKVLFNTGKSGTPELSFLRYLHTLNNVLKWYDLKPSQRVKSLDYVRRTHSNVAKKETMTQYDMVITQWAFIAPALLKTWQLGIDPISDEELNSMSYVIYCVGQAIGIDDDLNLCNGDLTETKLYSQMILTQVIQPSMKIENALNKEMADYLLQGMNIMNPYLSPSAFKEWAFELFDIENPGDLKTEKKKSFYSYFFDIFLHGQIGEILVRPIFSNLMRINIILANKWEKHVLIKWRRKVTTSIVTLGILFALILGSPVILLFLMLVVQLFIYNCCLI